MNSWYQWASARWHGLFFIKRFPVISQLIKFALVGVSSFFVDLGAYLLFTRLGGVYYLAANVCSFILAVVWSFFINKFWTFRSVDRTVIRHQFTKFLLVSTGGLILSTSLLYLFVDRLSWWDVITKFVVAIIVMFWNFTLNKLWTFK